MSTHSSQSPSDRRRQWLISRGLLSPTGPSRRLGALLPSTRRARSAEVDVRLESHHTPVIVARASSDRVRAPRAVSMPSDDAVAPGPRIARAASSRAEYNDRAASPPRRRFRMRRQKRRPRDDHHAKFPFVTPKSKITVVDRQLPRAAVSGREAAFDHEQWAEYRGKINQLAEDDRFMQYLTAPVRENGVLDDEESHPHPQQLAMNKLYPLAFIRLLEAHARYANQSEVVDPEEEAHRYDDLDGDDEDRVLRTASSGRYDMRRFRTVGPDASGYRRNAAGATSANLARLIEDRADRSVRDTSGLFSNFTRSVPRDNRTSFVPVY